MQPESRIMELFINLPKTEQTDLLVRLNNMSFKDDIIIDKPTSCKHCQSKDIVSNGSVKDKKRFKCKTCKRSFGAFSNTTYSGIKETDKFQMYKNIMFTEGVIPLKTMSTRVGISIQTSFDWRHKLMNPVGDKDSKFTGEVQIDDIWINYSQKGRKGLKYSKKRGGVKKQGDNNYQVKVLTITNKEQTIMKVAKIGRISREDIEENLGNNLANCKKLISDSHPSIISFAKKRAIKHVYFKSKDHKAKTGENVQLLNNQASRLKTLLNGTCKGVSTKYLQNYVNYFSFSETNKEKNKVATLKILEDNKGWDNFTTIEHRYKNFIMKHSERTYRCPVLRCWKSNNWNMKNFAS